MNGREKSAMCGKLEKWSSRVSRESCQSRGNVPSL